MSQPIEILWWRPKTYSVGTYLYNCILWPCHTFKLYQSLSSNFSSSRQDRKKMNTDSKRAQKFLLKNGVKCFWNNFGVGQIFIKRQRYIVNSFDFYVISFYIYYLVPNEGIYYYVPFDGYITLSHLKSLLLSRQMKAGHLAVIALL